MHGYLTLQLATAIQRTKVQLKQHLRINFTEETPDIEVLHVTQEPCNAIVACNTYFIAGYRPAQP